MARKIKWTKKHYAIALTGDTLPGLRKVVKKFEASDGYDIRSFSSWTNAQKRRVRDYYARVHLLEAQERYIVRPRKKENLVALQDAFHGDVGSKIFKVAFVPYTAPKQMPGAKPIVPEIKYLKRGIVIKTPSYSRNFIPFDKRALVADPTKEIKRVIDEMPDARMFYIQTGEFQTLNDKDAPSLTKLVIRYMGQYDGKTPLPRSSGNVGDSPKHHHWKYWLNGIVGYEFPEDVSEMDLARRIVAGIADSKNRRKIQDNKMKSKRKR